LTTCLSISDTPSNKDFSMEHQVVNAVIFRACLPMPLSERVADWGGGLMPYLVASSVCSNWLGEAENTQSGKGILTGRTVQPLPTSRAQQVVTPWNKNRYRADY